LSHTVSDKVRITNKLGLHARPAMMFVQAAARYRATITVVRVDDSQRVDGKSIMEMMMLAATSGTEILITASGEDADQAVVELVALVKSRFGEE
jgi:phosphocarrier protein